MRGLWWIAVFLILAASTGGAQQSVPSTDASQPPAQPAVERVEHPITRNDIEPQYPKAARKKHISGFCLVSMTVDVKGMPQGIKIVNCSDPLFEETSLMAALQYRFTPATTPEGEPVAANISLNITYHLNGGRAAQKTIRATFNSLPDVNSTGPGPDGVYPLTKAIAPPVLTNFADDGYRATGISVSKRCACDVVLTISEKGKPTNTQVTHCERPELEKLAVHSLLKSKYKPGSLNGKDVPIRASIHLEYAEIPSNP
jgi:TonB family protein